MRSLFFTLFLFFLNYLSLFPQSVGIGSTQFTPDPSSVLEVKSTTKGVLVPRVSLTSTTDNTTITNCCASYLTVYNTNASMTNGNGEGMYYWNGSQWQYMAAASNGPGAPGQVLTSVGSANPTWSTLSTSGGGNTGCASCISSTSADQGATTFESCRDACVALGAGWRIPTWDEELFISSGGLGLPTGGFINQFCWTSTPTDARWGGTATADDFASIDEKTGTWGAWPFNTGGTIHCRCVK